MGIGIYYRTLSNHLKTNKKRNIIKEKDNCCMGSQWRFINILKGGIYMSKNIKKFLVSVPLVIMLPFSALFFIISSIIGIFSPLIILYRGLTGQKIFTISSLLPKLSFIPTLIISILISAVCLIISIVLLRLMKKSIKMIFCYN